MTEEPKSQYTYMRPATQRKFAKLADLDRRSQVEEYDVLADELLLSRGLDPETLEPVAPDPEPATKR